MPGGIANVTHGEGVVRGVGFAVGMKGFGFSEGRVDSCAATVRLSVPAGRPLVEVGSTAAELGQGITAVQVAVARDELGIERVVLLPVDTSLGRAGSSSASRQTYMTGGAIHQACSEIKAELFTRAREAGMAGELRLAEAAVVSESGGAMRLDELLGDDVIERTTVYDHRPTEPLDRETGQGDAFLGFMFAGHRAVVDVDTDLGLVRVVELATVQDVGHIIDRVGVEGQIEGGSAQGLGLAIMEELQVEGGRVLNASFTDYLIPTTMDMPPVRSVVLEYPDSDSPLGVKGAGEAPTVSSGAAVVAAIEQAIGFPLTRVPIRPEHIVRPHLP
jgi:CO/xanthine dehydrogenase Mo-binding subunit